MRTFTITIPSLLFGALLVTQVGACKKDKDPVRKPSAARSRAL